jgi:hypothetical protein
MRCRLFSAPFAVVATLLLSSAAFAQVYGPASQGQRSPNDRKIAAAAPKPAYDPHDLSGVWYGTTAGNDVNLMTGLTWPNYTDNGKKIYQTHKPSAGADGVAPAFGNDPIGHCDPAGYPRDLYLNGRPFEFAQLPNKIWQIFEWDRANREIWLDGRQIPEDADPRWYGYAVGHWDGDTLVVHSADYNGDTWLDRSGHPHDENMTVDEKFVHPDAVTLEDTMTITDPTVYVTPLVRKPQVFKLQLPKGVTELREEICVPSEEESFNDNTRNRAAGTAKPVEVR